MLDERSLTKGEDKKKEKYVKGMKKSFSDFKSRYGDDAKSVMYATATKMAKEATYPSDFKKGSGVAKKKYGRPQQHDQETDKSGRRKTVDEGAYDKFDRIVRSAGAVKNPQTKIKLLKVAAQQRPKVAEETLDEALPVVVSGALAVGKMAAKQHVKAGIKKAGAALAKKKAKDTVVAKTPEPEKKEPEEKEDNKDETRVGISSVTKKKDDTVEKGVKKGYDSVKKKVTGFTKMFDPKESYEQEGELLTFSDFREVVGICNSDAEELDEFNIIQKAMDVVDKVNRTNQKKVDMINKTRPGSASMPKHGYFTPQKKTNESAAWTRKAGKNKEGGLNEKGRKSYEKENPGSDLKAPSKKVGNPRRASFCARMKGMKKKLTSKKTASDPDSRINKSLRAWNC